MGSRLVAVARLARLANTHGSLAPIDPWLTKTMERVRTGAVVDVPKGTVVVGDRRRAPQAGELVEMSRVSAATVSAGADAESLAPAEARTAHKPSTYLAGVPKSRPPKMLSIVL